MFLKTKNWDPLQCFYLADCFWKIVYTTFFNFHYGNLFFDLSLSLSLSLSLLRPLTIVTPQPSRDTNTQHCKTITTLGH